MLEKIRSRFTFRRKIQDAKKKSIFYSLILQYKELGILLFFILITTLATHPNFIYSKLEVGRVSDRDIYAPKDVTYEDKNETERLKREALASVQNVYVIDNAIHQNLSNDVNEFIESLITFKQQIKQEQLNQLQNTSFNINLYTQLNIEKVNNPFGFKKEELLHFLEITESDLKRIQSVFIKESEKILASGVTEENLKGARQQFKDNPRFYYFPQRIQDLMTEKISERIVSNVSINVEQTEKLKKEALDKVEPVSKEIKKGIRILLAGEQIDENHIVKLKALGFIHEDSKSKFDVSKRLAFIAIAFILFHLYCFKFYKSDFKDIKNYIFVLSLITCTLIISNMIKDSGGQSLLNYFYLTPFITALTVFVTFWGRKFVIVSAIILSILISSNDVHDLFLSLVAAIILAITFKHHAKRDDFIISGLLLGLTLSLVSLAYMYSTEKIIDWNEIKYLTSSSVTASMVTVGIMIPFVEHVLGLITSIRLRELSDSNHPLMTKLYDEAQGTYHHSLMVGTLATSVADDLGANALLLKVAANFHDVGKMKNPMYFIENVPSGYRNPHEFLDPVESAKIISEHPLESARICKEYKIPKAVIDLILSHHSDAVLHHLYIKAKETNPNTDINLFRYKTPTPKTKEEGILLLADSIEAYSRVLMEKGTSPEELEKAIRELIFKKVEHGDLRDCELMTKDIHIIIKKFTKYLTNAYHKRIPYIQEKKES